MFSSTQRGILILVCRQKSAQEVGQIKDFEDARRATAHTAQFKEVWRRKKMQPSSPLDTYYELRYRVNTFCALLLLWTLFGDECNHYKEILKIFGDLGPARGPHHKGLLHTGCVPLHHLGNLYGW